LTTSPEPTEVWCWFISTVLWGSLSAEVRALIVLFANYVIYSALNVGGNKGRKKYKKRTIPT
ncbi:hypothetical protein, partial [Klebsiella michiganensis]|uniref:hypothetical protein n=1 Tax=Klebsiella michiganensis TaxID=1134687 RepID=UPI0025420328